MLDLHIPFQTILLYWLIFLTDINHNKYCITVLTRGNLYSSKCDSKWNNSRIPKEYDTKIIN